MQLQCENVCVGSPHLEFEKPTAAQFQVAEQPAGRPKRFDVMSIRFAVMSIHRVVPSSQQFAVMSIQRWSRSEILSRRAAIRGDSGVLRLAAAIRWDSGVLRLAGGSAGGSRFDCPRVDLPGRGSASEIELSIRSAGFATWADQITVNMWPRSG